MEIHHLLDWSIDVYVTRQGDHVSSHEISLWVKIPNFPLPLGHFIGEGVEHVLCLMVETRHLLCRSVNVSGFSPFLRRGVG